MFAPKCRSVTISEQTHNTYIYIHDRHMYVYIYTLCIYISLEFTPSINVHVSVDVCMDVCIDIWIEKSQITEF